MKLIKQYYTKREIIKIVNDELGIYQQDRKLTGNTLRNWEKSIPDLRGWYRGKYHVDTLRLLILVTSLIKIEGIRVSSVQRKLDQIKHMKRIHDKLIKQIDNDSVALLDELCYIAYGIKER